ncbi:MAG: WbqC family protein [Bacillota bacterium]
MILSGHQPNYLPWLGFFHKMMSCDLFVILDDVIHSRREITNKNKIKGPEGARLLSVPRNRSDKRCLIKDVTIAEDNLWHEHHWGSLYTCYARSPYLKKYEELFWAIYTNPGKKLAQLNLRLIHVIREVLEINTPLVLSSEISGITGSKGTRIINLCKHLNADVYLSGTGARAYNDEKEFEGNNIRLVYQEFEHPVYPQLWSNFIPGLSAVDLIFNCGPRSKDYLRKQVIV